MIDYSELKKAEFDLYYADLNYEENKGSFDEDFVYELVNKCREAQKHYREVKKRYDQI